MNYKTVKRVNKEIDAELVKSLSERLTLPTKLVELLVARNIDSMDAIQVFLSPKTDYFYDPMTMRDMAEAVERINIALKNNENVVVFGDYDADGICASAMLTTFLARHGANVYTHIPDRLNDGYGLSISCLDKIVESCYPDLIITCDCGITAIKEVEHVKEDLGVDIIVTDHHKVGDGIPNCPTVNPHREDCNYPFKELCGAGVAFKLIHALSSLEEACEYLDLVTLATIADLMPLVDENRLIVQLGLKQMEKGQNIGLKMLTRSLQLFTVAASDVSFKLAPRINAAGRMGSAERAFRLFIEEDRDEIAKIIDDLNADNERRKTLCAKMYDEACALLKGDEVVGKRAIILSNPNWEKGVTGILAAKIVNDFNRPVMIIVNSGEECRGTCRSIPGINIYDILNSCSDLFIEFGGHNQAAGFTIKEENVAELKRRVNELLQDYPFEAFLPVLNYDLEVTEEEITRDFANALELMEPTGNENPKPQLLIRAKNIKVTPYPSNPCHTVINLPSGTQMLGFNFKRRNYLLKGDKERKIVFDISLYNGAPKYYLRGVAPDTLSIDDEHAKANYLKTLMFKKADKVEVKTYDNLQDVVDSPFGILIIAGCEDTYKKICALNLTNIVFGDFIKISERNNYTRIIVSPDIDADFNSALSTSRKVVFADSPLSEGFLQYIKGKTDAEIYIPKNGVYTVCSALDTERASMIKYYNLFKSSKIAASDYFEYYLKVKAKDSNLSADMFVFCMAVFLELNFIQCTKDRFSILVNNGSKRTLDESEVYASVKSILGK